MLNACRRCGDTLISVRVHDTDGVVHAYCDAHAPFVLSVDDEAEQSEQGYAGGARDPDTLYDLAVTRLRGGAPEAALAPLRALLEQNPDRVAPIELLSDCCYALGQLEKALTHQSRALDLLPARGEGHARCARLLAIRGDVDQALSRYEEGAKADPFHLQCIRRAAILHIARKDAERALTLCEGYLEETEKHTQAIRHVDVRRPTLTARDFKSRLELVEASQTLQGRRSHEVAAGRYVVRLLVGDALQSLGRIEEAEATRTRAIDELVAVPDLLLAEVGPILGEELEALRARVSARRADTLSGPACGGDNSPGATSAGTGDYDGTVDCDDSGAGTGGGHNEDSGPDGPETTNDETGSARRGPG